jgi:flagellar protein FliO/FliZ
MLRPIACLALLAAAGSALAAAEAVAASPLHLLAALAAVLIVLGATAWLVRRWAVPARSAAGLLRTVAAVAVGPRERIVLLEIGSTWLLVGVAPGRVVALATMARPAQMPHGSEQPPAARPFIVRLREQLRRPERG